MKVVVVHGCFGSPEENWFPWLAKRLFDLGDTVSIPRFPTPENQNLGSWRAVFRREIGAIDGDTVLIGHSAGASFVLRMIEESGQAAGAVFLVAPFVQCIGVPEFDPLIEPFVSSPFDWCAIRKNCGTALAYAGDNDPWVPLRLSSAVAEGLGIPLTVISGGGHLNASAGYIEFERLLSDYQAVRAARL